MVVYWGYGGGYGITSAQHIEYLVSFFVTSFPAPSYHMYADDVTLVPLNIPIASYMQDG